MLEMDNNIREKRPGYANIYKLCVKQFTTRAVIVVQLVKPLLLILEVHGSNPVIGKIYVEHLFTVNCIEKTKIKKKRPGIAHFLKQNHNCLNRCVRQDIRIFGGRNRFESGQRKRLEACLRVRALGGGAPR